MRWVRPWSKYAVMKHFSTLVLLPLAMMVRAQEPLTWHFTFDADADRSLDSLHGCGQVGAPQKAVFDSAWSAPNALVTDTLQPYPVGGISYADFSVPVNWFGEFITLSFRHRLAIDPGEGYGWLEWFDPVMAEDWVRADPDSGWTSGYIGWNGEGLNTDSGLVFTGTNNGWGLVELEWVCIGLLHDPGERDEYPDSMRFRFGFRSFANTNGRDGWMIDELVASNLGCMGSVHEPEAMELDVYPNPTVDQLVLERTNADPLLLRLIRSDGALVRQERMTGPRHALELSDLSEGAYLLIASEGALQRSYRVLIQR